MTELATCVWAVIESDNWTTVAIFSTEELAAAFCGQRNAESSITRYGYSKEPLLTELPS